MKKINIVKCIVFLAAFLLFQIELIMVKTFMPKFGGVYSVWGAAVVFFQATLLLGYLYSYTAIRKLGIFRYRYAHLGLMALTLLFFPGKPLITSGLLPNLPMVINIFWQLLCTIGPAFFFLSTTSIIFQSWVASSKLDERLNPYTLYGVSNLGSFAALITYPFLFELTLDLNAQANIWRIAYMVLVGLNIAAFRMVKVSAPVKEAEAAPVRLDTKDGLKWLLLGAAGVMMFLSVTNVITYDVIPIPLLWILPLAVYLLSFILNFKKVPWCPNWINGKIHIVLAVSVAVYFLMEAKFMESSVMIIAYLAVLFGVCMFCQNELYKSRPQAKGDLTLFYLLISLGGFLGGIVVSWIVPLVSSSTIEYLLALLVVALALTISQERPLFVRKYMWPIFWLIIMLIIWPLIFWGYNVFGMIIMLWAFCSAYYKLKEKPSMIALSLLLILAMASSPAMNILWSKQKIIYKHRNYYGIYKVDQAQEKRGLANGNTMHGAQYIVKGREMIPLTYYHYSTPMGRVLMSGDFEFKRIGMIGLGVGTLAAYGNPGQTIDFFEIDPDVYKIATKYFTYLKNSKAKLNFIFGDARITLKKVSEDYYDILMVDAFSGDYVPTHLLTTDAIGEYKEHLTKNGMVLFHVSNRYLGLKSILFANANVLGAYSCVSSNPASIDAASSEWVALTWNEEVFKTLTSQLKWKPCPKNLSKWIRPWTDSYTNIFSVLRIGYLIDGIRMFQPFYWNFNFSAKNNKNMKYYAAQGSRSLLESNFNQASDYYEKALDLKPDDAGVLRNLGNSYYLSGQYMKAISSYRKAVEINPDDAVALRDLGRACAKENMNDDAVAYYKKSIDADPGSSKAFLGLGGVYNVLGMYDDATACYKKAAELNPGDLNVAKAYKSQQDITRCKKILETNANDKDALLDLGNAYHFLKQYVLAIETYRKLEAISPNDSNAAEKLGDSYNKAKDYSQASIYYLKAIKLKPQDEAGVLYKIGRLYVRQKEYPQALDYFNKAIAMDPLAEYIYMDIAFAHFALKNYDQFAENAIKARKFFYGKNDIKSVKMLDMLMNKAKAEESR